MIVVEEKQFSEKIIAATRMVGDELSEYKGNMLSQGGNTLYPWKQDQSTLEMLRPSTVASRFTAAQISDKIRKAFVINGLAKIRFEFAFSFNQSFWGGDLL